LDKVDIVAGVQWNQEDCREMKGLQGKRWVDNTKWIGLNKVEVWIKMEWTHTGKQSYIQGAQLLKYTRKY